MGEENILGGLAINNVIKGKTDGNGMFIVCHCLSCGRVWTPRAEELNKPVLCLFCVNKIKEEEERKRKEKEKQSKENREQHFINRAKKIHSGYYDYSLVKYINRNTKVKIICPVHGVFEQYPGEHLKGCGCGRCAKTGFLAYDSGKLYIMVDDLEAPTMIKIGVSVNEDKRSREVLKSARRAGVSIPALYVAKTWEGPTDLMQRIESMMHENYAEWNIKFPAKFDGCTEFFYYTPETAEAFDIIEETYNEIVNASKAA